MVISTAGIVIVAIFAAIGLGLRYLSTRDERGSGPVRVASRTINGLAFPTPFALVRPSDPASNPFDISYSQAPVFHPQPAPGEQMLLRIAATGEALMPVGSDGGPVIGGSARPMRIVYGPVEVIVTDRRMVAVFGVGDSILGSFNADQGTVLTLVQDLNNLTYVSFEFGKAGPVLGFEDIDHFGLVRLTDLDGVYADGRWNNSTTLAQVLPLATRAIAQSRLASASASDRPVLERALAGHLDSGPGGAQVATLKADRSLGAEIR